MNNLLEKAKSMGKVVADSGAKTMLKVSDISLLVYGLEFCSTMSRVLYCDGRVRWFRGARGRHIGNRIISNDSDGIQRIITWQATRQ